MFAVMSGFLLYEVGIIISDDLGSYAHFNSSLSYNPEFTVKLPFLSPPVQRNTRFNCLVCNITRILQTVLNFGSN
jgi:hypothetical protein